MKIALCLHGLADGKNSKGKPVRAEIGAKCFAEKLFKQYDVDVFLHSWSVDVKEDLIKWYQPKKYMFENQINFITDFKKKECMEKIRNAHCKSIANKYKKPAMEDGKQRCYQCWKFEALNRFDQDPYHRSCTNCYWHNKLYYRNLCSMYYSFYQANKLKCYYEAEQGFKYDLVITARFDLYVGKVCDLSKLDPEKFYFLNYDTKTKKHIIDHMFLSSSENIDDFCDIYPNLEKYTKDYIKMGSYNQYLNHDSIKIHFKKLDLMHILKQIGDQIEAGAMTTVSEEWLREKCPYAFDD